MKIIYNDKQKIKRIYLSAEKIEANLADFNGYCIACGELADGIDPNTRAYECEFCKRFKVYGMEELLVAGFILTDPEEEN